MHETAEALGIGMGKVAQPLRVAITGTQVSPDIAHTVYLAGQAQGACNASTPPSPRCVMTLNARMSHAHACTDPHHHVHDGNAFVNEVERLCGQRGLRLTPLRANALRLIADAGRPSRRTTCSTR